MLDVNLNVIIFTYLDAKMLWGAGMWLADCLCLQFDWCRMVATCDTTSTGNVMKESKNITGVANSYLANERKTFTKNYIFTYVN